MNTKNPKENTAILNNETMTIERAKAYSHYPKMVNKNQYDYPVLRVMSINVNGIRAAAKKGLFKWLEQSDADVVCMQETRIDEALWRAQFMQAGWYCDLFAAQKPGYAGVAIYSRIPIQKIQTGLGFDSADSEGRFICAQLDVSAYQHKKPVYIASLYLPSGSSGAPAQAKKDAFLQQYQAILQNWQQQQKSIIICGDYNIVHKKIDIKNWSGNQKSSGCLPHERAWLDFAYDELGYIDSFRQVCSAPHVYSWWSNRGQARNKNVGWRIDYQMCSKDWQDTVLGAWVYTEQWFSDHAPVIVDYRLG